MINSLFGISSTSLGTTPDIAIDIVVNKDTKYALEKIANDPLILNNLIPMFNAGFQILNDFKCNKDTSILLKERLSLVATTLAELQKYGEFPKNKVSLFD